MLTWSLVLLYIVLYTVKFDNFLTLIYYFLIKCFRVSNHIMLPSDSKFHIIIVCVPQRREKPPKHLSHSLKVYYSCRFMGPESLDIKSSFKVTIREFIMIPLVNCFHII